MGTTLLQLRTEVRTRTNMESRGFVQDDEVDVYINEGIRELYQRIITVDESYGLATLDFSLLATPTGNTRALPSDFFRARGLDKDPDTNSAREIRQFNFQERNKRTILSFRVDGTTLIVQPWSACAGAYRLYYVPDAAALQLVNDEDVLNADLERLRAFVAVWAAIRCLEKSERPQSAAMSAELERLTAQIPTIYGARQSEAPTVPIVRRYTGLPPAWGGTRGFGNNPAESD